MSGLTRKILLRGGAFAALGAMALAKAAPAIAESQSSDSSSDCSNGRCRRVDRLTIENERGRRGYVRTERWREGRRDREEDDDRRRAAPWRDRGRDDDD
jgi:hypothetical protein